MTTAEQIADVERRAIGLLRAKALAGDAAALGLLEEVLRLIGKTEGIRQAMEMADTAIEAACGAERQ